MPASAEFVALCQAQVTLLTQSLGAALSIIYLTEELTEVADAKLIPVVAYPEAIATWDEDQILSLLSRRQRRSKPRLLSAKTVPSDDPASLTALSASSAKAPSLPLEAAEKAMLRQQQLVLPLIHEDTVMGLLVTARSDRAWSEAEQTQLKQVAQTLAVACVLDQRSQWMTQDLRQQEMLWEQRQDLFDDLLHQFRNPLTALRTFGKLLMRRLQPGDTNHPVADGIVRESNRLEDLLKQLDIAADLNDLILPAQPASVALLPESLTGAACQLERHAIIEVLEPLLESAAAIAQDRQLTLQSKIPSLPPVQTDVKMLREVLSNLLDNALKYTPAGGGVWVQVEDQKKMQAIVIADTGAGIPPQDLPRLFERHYRGVQAKTTIPGSGLGLAIARELLHAMQADLEIFSPAPTCGLLPADYPMTGTAVVVWLPSA
ncbi:MAG: GAF domain-containing sensor histidine kinase [Timaviella obliquedivisa GSE-PSE-MK23-08B]|nr:GAF domain-containing sensor histidine kinase [Timaviella obliquedivisa GSE-PSE-MK23-08B]